MIYLAAKAKMVVSPKLCETDNVLFYFPLDSFSFLFEFSPFRYVYVCLFNNS
jgi:hypothetical protein